MPARRPAAAGSRFSLAAPPDYLLHRDACSYGYFLLAPNHWDPLSRTLRRPLDLAGGPVLLTIDQPRPGGSLRIRTTRTLGRPERTQAAALVTRMLRLDESAETIAQFHAVDPRFAPSGRGRLMRSPTFFEDVIKTVTSCNVTWPSTVQMNARLCRVAGRRVPGAAAASAWFTFPTPARLARTKPAKLRARCRVGYRDARIVALAKLFASGAIDTAWFQSPSTPDDAVFDALIELPGIGPYAAANIMQLLGRYARLPLDTESVRHGKTVLGMTGSAKAIMKKLDAHYAPFGPHAFRSYWFELWNFYESRRGPAHTWDRDTTGTTFTAAQL